MLVLSDNLCRLMLSIYDESQGTTKPVDRRMVLLRLNQRKEAAMEEGKVSINMLPTLFKQLEKHQLIRKAGKSDIAAVLDIVGFRAYILQKIAIEFCDGATILLIQPAIRVIGANNLKRHLHEH